MKGGVCGKAKYHPFVAQGDPQKGENVSRKEGYFSE
jgi:hypothetical protein